MKDQIKISSSEKRKLIKELKIDPTHLEQSLKRKELDKHYQGNLIGKIANLFFEPISAKILESSHSFSKRLHKNIMASGMQTLSLSYLSLCLFTSFLVLFIGTAIGAILMYFTNSYPTIFLGLILSTLTIIIFIFYLRIRITKRKNEIEQELPFLVTHFAALANSNLKGINLFKPFLHSKYYHCIKTEIRRIITNHSLMGYSLEESIKEVAEATPSKKLKEFFLELLTSIKKNDTKSYLRTKSKILLSQYQLKRTGYHKRFFNTYNELRNSLRQLHFRIEHYSVIILSIILILLNTYFFYSQTITFLTILILSLLFGWSLILIDIYKSFKRNRKLEVEFFKFTKEFKKTRSLLKIKGNYKVLKPYLTKLINQYKSGIPFDKALRTFSLDIGNQLIQATVYTALEAKKHGADLTTTLTLITDSKIKRNKLKF